jgi:hypothetical protein
MAVHACHHSYVGSISRRLTVQPSPDIKQDPISKITRAKWTSGVAPVVERMPNKCKALSPIPSTITHTKKAYYQLISEYLIFMNV